MRALLDTNVLVDYLRGVEPAKGELARYKRPAISIVTWMEILVGAESEAETTTLRGFLSRFAVIPLDEAVAECAVAVRKRTRIRLPDAIIWASALVHEHILVTRNTRDFPADEPGVRVPYVL